MRLSRQHILWRMLFAPILVTVIFSSRVWSQGECADDLKKAEVLFRETKYDSALFYVSHCLENRVPADSSKLDALVLKGRIYFTMHDSTGARTAFTRVLNISVHFELDPVFETADLVAFFDRIKSDLDSRAVEEDIEKEEELEEDSPVAAPVNVDGGMSKWYYIGGGAAAAATAIWLLWPPDEFPKPVGRPTE